MSLVPDGVDSQQLHLLSLDFIEAKIANCVSHTLIVRQYQFNLLSRIVSEYKIAEGVAVDISMDFMELPKSVNGYDYVLVVVDPFSKYTTIIPTTKEITALGTAKLIHQHVWIAAINCKRSYYLIHDQFYLYFNNQTITFRSRMGFIPVSPIKMFRNNNLSNRELIREMVKDNMLEADGIIKNKPTCQIGDWMFVKDEFINLEVGWNTNTGSINNKNHGPFKILKIFKNDIHVELELDFTTNRHKFSILINGVQFKLNKDNELLVKGVEPDIIDNEEEFEIEQIIGDRMYRRKKQYLGYPLDKATWQYSKNMDHAKDLIKEYETTRNNKSNQRRRRSKSLSRAEC
ncbi:hypothetical protein PPL_05821 [Heterostelium album PN500]|uniref:Uncharacterized protein n=1 Tax=Heterostelium pallidum (strain ATCC 26659 / Pp 5 / PN500) TaxID=670386 RepID=D3BBF4_HETP5|nr:hypothetical protein PPL_05821 [Heterostelium album PN500]EFA80987.1 hypothetical protein PPL_05821 [Heterostelium album PN500]|eukprot:XP_020433105.1 hypothetical protein PPL_05821 [Heterostelium album PN500]